MYPKPPLFLPIFGASFGFDDEGVLVEIRFHVSSRQGAAIMRLRGKDKVAEALRIIGAKSCEDLNRAYASVDDSYLGRYEFNAVPLATREHAVARLNSYADIATQFGHYEEATGARKTAASLMPAQKQVA